MSDHQYICEECWIPLEHGVTRCPNCTVPMALGEAKGTYTLLALILIGALFLLFFK